ncbi:MAG: hypothetical protein R3324_17925, partial [Halobacteriales archaeon]|nr:hypothetical protein [Halobacteriales archaeon]
VIPEANVDHLMLAHDVREAVDEGLFNVWSVSTIEEAIEVLTGVSAGEWNDDEGRFSEGSVFDRVDAELQDIADRIREAEADEDDSEDGINPSEGG